MDDVIVQLAGLFHVPTYHPKESLVEIREDLKTLPKGRREPREKTAFNEVVDCLHRQEKEEGGRGLLTVPFFVIPHLFHSLLLQ